jgi:hypothetical protein
MRIHSPAFQCCGSGIRDKHPGSSILVLFSLQILRFLFIELFCLWGGKLLSAFLIPLCCISVHREGHHCGLQVKKLRDPPRLDPVAEKHDLVVHAQLGRWVLIFSPVEKSFDWLLCWNSKFLFQFLSFYHFFYTSGVYTWSFYVYCTLYIINLVLLLPPPFPPTSSPSPPPC